MPRAQEVLHALMQLLPRSRRRVRKKLSQWGYSLADNLILSYSLSDDRILALALKPG